MKITAMCGSGLGSSFMVEMNINAVLSELNISGIEVDHIDLSSATPTIADLFVVGRDIAESLNDSYKSVVVLNNIMSKVELKEKLSVVLQEKGIL